MYVFTTYTFSVFCIEYFEYRYRVFGIKFSTSFRKCIYPYKRILSECFFSSFIDIVI